MYGTIARMRVKPGRLDDLVAWAERQRSLESDRGAMLVYQSDADPEELWLVVAAENREIYRARSESPRQTGSFYEMMEFLEAEPEWHDGEIVSMDANL